MPLQALFLDEMIDNETELIALNSNDDDIFYLISLRRNHKDHVPRIREYYEEVRDSSFEIREGGWTVWDLLCVKYYGPL